MDEEKTVEQYMLKLILDELRKMNEQLTDVRSLLQHIGKRTF